VDGLTVMGQTVSDEVIGKLAATGLPMVLLARDPVPGVDTVRAENKKTAEALVGHLLEHGHERFVFLGDPDGSPDVRGRWSGVRAGLAKAGAAPAKLVPIKGLDVAAGRAAAGELDDRPQAVICANDELALGVLLERPGQTVTGWDDLMAAQFAGLTTVRQPMRELGATAARWLNRRITVSDNAAAARRRVLPTRLVVRTSCGNHSPEVHR
jgi:LacI family transcriptional regulator